MDISSLTLVCTSNELKGDSIQVIAQHPNGWWGGEVNGRRGYFPSTYVRLVDGGSESSVEENISVLLKRLDMSVQVYHSAELSVEFSSFW